MACLIFEVNRFNSGGRDFIVVKGIDNQFNEVAKIDIDWQELQGKTNQEVKLLVKTARQAINDIIDSRLNVKKESLKETLVSKVSSIVNEDIPGQINDSNLASLKARVYE